MDAFLSEIFDVRGVDHTPFLDTTGGLSHALMMQDARLVLNAAFRYAWSQLSGGALPSARCFAEFRARQPPGSDPVPEIDLEAMTGWMLKSPDGPFQLMQGTRLMQERLALLRDGRFDVHVGVLKDPMSDTLHRAVVEKLVDRHMVLSSLGQIKLQVEKYMHTSLFVVYKDLTAGTSRTIDMTNLASGMIASHEEESLDVGQAVACRAPLRVGRGDSIKRRFSRDLHYQRRQFEKPYVTAQEHLMEYAEIVRMAIGAPWAVQEAQSCEVEQHAPVIASASVRLYTYERGGGGLRAPAPTVSTCATVTSSMLILFCSAADVTDAELSGFGEALGYKRVFRAHVGVGGSVIGSKSKSKDEKRLVYPLYFGDGADHWSYGLLASCLRRHLASPCPLQTQDRLHAPLLIDRCITSLALAKGILGLGIIVTCSPLGSAKHVILAVDTRPDPSATILSVMLALSNLERSADWAVRIMCSRRNRHEFERMLLPMCPGATFDSDTSELNVPVEAFDVQSSYNALMKNPATWKALLPARIVLTVQDDGLLLRRGVEKLMEDVVYLGAPWADELCNAPLKAMVPTLVGNGGLSLRNVLSMIKMSEGVSQADKMRLFHTRAEPIPEDVMYAALASVSPLPSQIVSAKSLACEQVPFASALGFHKPWPYWSVADTHAHMQQLIDEVDQALPGVM